MPLAVAGGVIAIVLLIVYVIVQSMGGEEQLSASDKAEQDDSPDLPGVYIPSQGRGHLSYTFSLEREPRPFCAGVRHAGNAGETPASTPTAQSTPTPKANATVEASGTGTPRATPTVPLDCFNSNPPSSGGLSWMVGWNKPEFLGSDVLHAQKVNGPPKVIVGFEMTERAIGRHGHPVFHDGRQVGVVTSGTQTPFLKKAIGMAYVPPSLKAPGTEIEIDIRGRRAKAVVVPLPFYKRAK